MTNQVFTETLIFTRCARYTTDTCPSRKNTAMGLAEINAPPKCFLLNDQTVEELNKLCSNCSAFTQKKIDCCINVREITNESTINFSEY